MRIGLLTALVCTAGLVACGGEAPEAPEPETDAPAAAEPAQPAAAPAAALPRTAAPEGARVYFISPGDGDEVESPVNVVFGLSGAGVAPAGIVFPDSGHHHLLVDAEMPPENLPVPTDDRHIHFGLGQSEAAVELAPGAHTLQLVLGDHLHIPHDPPVVSEVITVTVVE